ncbi:mucin-5AC-like [Perca flavescens]|uniref:mucin-5AC-like n=1 Tax=Perca flavescens TaxID=8167 RepID=UPI00106DD6DA|nr:mucin-5AC-like [Perca flavescens]
MTSLKMCCLLLPLAALLLLLTIVPTVTEVVKSMSDCPGFLLDESPPNVPGILEGGNILDQNRYKPICQTFNNSRSFVTLYDTKNRIPVFSAYKYTGSKGKRPKDIWKIEPQLEDITDIKKMRTSNDQRTYNNQAGNADYTNQSFDRGHLFPSSYALTENDKKSTFTLTNIVPQQSTFNQGSWKQMESCIKCVLDKYCFNNNVVKEGFLVTGAQPGQNNMNNRVNIPSMLWSAFCCYSQSKGWLASAHWGDNIPETGVTYMQTKTLADLQNQLGTLTSVVFPGTQCPLHTTITHLYPNLNTCCKCPPTISTTSASPSSTYVPLSTTSSPLSTTSVSLSTTSASLSTTSVPTSTTSAPRSTTSAPRSTTSAPLSTTSAPRSTTSAPLSTTSAPLSTTSAPLTTTSAPLTTTSAPRSTTSAPLSTTSAPRSTTSVSVSTTTTTTATTKKKLV